MALDTAKLIGLREQIDTILKKRQLEDNDRYRKLALGLENKLAEFKMPPPADNSKVIAGIKDLQIGLVGLLSKPDSSPKVIEAINRLGMNLVKILSAKQPDRSTDALITALARLEQVLGKSGGKSPDRTDELLEAIKGIKLQSPSLEFPSGEMPVHVLSMPPQKIPQPVTNININPLRGFVHTTAATVTSTLTQLPTYGELDNRRSIMVFNNDASVTMFIGGSDLTAVNGLPVLAQTYSPSLDAGVNMILYGITASASVNVRVIEVSNDAIGG